MQTPQRTESDTTNKMPHVVGSSVFDTVKKKITFLKKLLKGYILLTKKKNLNETNRYQGGNTWRCL